MEACFSEKNSFKHNKEMLWMNDKRIAVLQTPKNDESAVARNI